MTKLIKIGYIHTGASTDSSIIQKEKLSAANCNIIFSDYSTDVDYKRIELVKAVEYAEKNKNCSIIVYSLEYLGASLENLSDIIKVIGSKNIPVQCLKENIIIYPYTTCFSNIGEKILSNRNPVGYAHPFEGDSQATLQIQLLNEKKCNKIFSGITNSQDFEREELIKAVKYAESASHAYIIVNSLERFAASIENMSDICRVTSGLDIPLLSIDENIVIVKNDEFTAFSLIKSENKNIDDTKNGKQTDLKDDAIEQKNDKGHADNADKPKMTKASHDIIPDLKLESKETIIVPSRTARRKKIFFIKLSICLISIFVILAVVYYKLRTAYDKEEIFDSEYVCSQKEKK